MKDQDVDAVEDVVVVEVVVVDGDMVGEMMREFIVDNQGTSLCLE